MGGNLERYYNVVLRRRCEAMIDRVNLASGEAYEFQTDGNQYVIVVNVSNVEVQVFKGDFLLARLNFLETYSCPSNTGPYKVYNPSTRAADVIFVRYILL
jgi:hypothetical protein